MKVSLDALRRPVQKVFGGIGGMRMSVSGLMVLVMGTSSTFAAPCGLSSASCDQTAVARRHIQLAALYDPAAAVRSFYFALESADGLTASEQVVPELRDRPAFSPEALTYFYSRVAEPLRLLDVERVGDNVVIARYRFGRSNGTTCFGKATVTTTFRDGRAMIERISANC